MDTVIPFKKKYVLLTTIPLPPVNPLPTVPAAPAATMKYRPVVPTVHVCTPVGIAYVLTVAERAVEPRPAGGVGYVHDVGPAPLFRFPLQIPRL